MVDEIKEDKPKKSRSRPVDQDFMSLVKKLKEEEPKSPLSKILTKASREWREPKF